MSETQPHPESDPHTDLRNRAWSLSWAAVGIVPGYHIGESLEYKGNRRVAEYADDPAATQPGSVVRTVSDCRLDFIVDGSLLVTTGTATDGWGCLLPAMPNAQPELWRYRNRVATPVQSTPEEARAWFAERLGDMEAFWRAADTNARLFFRAVGTQWAA